MISPFGPLVTRYITFYSEISESMLSRWERASREVRNRRYDATSLISDAMATWFDAGMLLRPPIPEGDAPAIELPLDRTTQTASEAQIVPHVDERSVQRGQITRIGDGVVLGGNTTVKLSTSGNSVIVDFDNTGGQPLAPGRYTARIETPSGVKVADLTVIVRP